MKKISIFKNDGFLLLVGTFALFFILAGVMITVSECTGWWKPKQKSYFVYVDVCHPDLDRAIEIEREAQREIDDRDNGRNHEAHEAMRDFDSRIESGDYGWNV